MHEAPEVHKFGGSCLRDRSDLERIAHIVHEADRPVVLVVSALWGTTDRLIRAANEPRYAGRLVSDLAKQHLRFAPNLLDSDLGDLFQGVLAGIEIALEGLASDPNNVNFRNRLLAAGERLSALVVAHALQEHGINASPFGAEDIGIKMCGTGHAVHVDVRATKDAFDRKILNGTPVITGWFGEGEDGELALLSRGGSDHTATALASLLDANRVVLWKDVAGIFPINPRWGVTGQPIPYLGYGEAIEFAHLDAPILHPATVEPVYELGIPIEIRHLYHYKKSGLSTIIGPDILGSIHPKGIACVQKVALLIVQPHSHRDKAMSLGDAISRLQERQIQICSYEVTPRAWKFIVPQHDLRQAIQELNPYSIDMKYQYFSALLSIIGEVNSDDISSLIHEFDQDAKEIHSTNHATHFLTQQNNISMLLENLLGAFRIGI